MDNAEYQAGRQVIGLWQKDVFAFIDHAFGMLPAEPFDELKGKIFPRKDTFGRETKIKLFDLEGRLTHYDLQFYEIWMFKDQERQGFKQRRKLTWQQTVLFTAYNRAINTFGKDSYEEALRWITARSGHGIGKTAAISIISMHFLFAFPGSQIGMTANTEQQVQDVFMKEFWVWRNKLPLEMKNALDVTSDHIHVEGEDDWFLRAQVARQEKPEALAGLHGEFILVLAEEASGIHEKVFETMKGAFTDEYYVVIYVGNPTRNEGEFFESHKEGSRFTKLHFSSRQSPIVKEGYIKTMEEDYPSYKCTWLEKGHCTSECVHSDEVKIRVDGEHAGVAEMDEKGWMPLFANITINMEPDQGQIINRGILGFDPAGGGKNRAVGCIRDNIYLKEVMNEETSNPKDGARKVETIRDAYNCSSGDIAIEAFGVGAQWVANIITKMGETVNAILTDKPREEVKDKYHTFRSELGWLFREWCAKGGIIITNNRAAWLKELEKMKYKRDKQGRIMLMNKVEFKKEYGFSPDLFDAACMTFFKEEPIRPVILTKAQLESKENLEFLQKAQRKELDENKTRNLSSM